jgi:succinyl-diaminopimelate desuccinylase
VYNCHAMKELLRKLIQAETIAEKGELAAAEIISAHFSRFGISNRVDSWDKNRANLIAHIESAGRKPAILFVCHLDVVGPGEAKWEHPPFEAVESNGRIYGRGAADMKGGIAAIVKSICQVIDEGTNLQGDIVFLAAAGEETDSCGIKRFLANMGDLPQLVGVVIPEPTDFAVITAHRGMIWLKVTTKGKAAHSSSPELGVNAITSMRAFLDELDKYKINVEPHKLLGSCSMSVNTISGGKAMNVVPDECTIGVDIRTLPGQNHEVILNDFRQILTKLKKQHPTFEAEVSVDRAVEAIETEPDCGFAREFCNTVGVSETKAVSFTTDAPHLKPLGAPIIIFGPGKPELCHKPDEYIDLADVEKAVRYYKNIILKFLV